MARNPSSFAKRQREIQRQQKRVAKARKRTERRDRKGTVPGETDEDPDIAGIVPGPQAQPWMNDFDPDEDAVDEDSDPEYE